MTMEGMFPNVAVCPQCASATRPGEKFCGVCGARVTAASVAAVPPSTVRQPDNLVAKPRNRSRLILVVAGAIAVAVALALLAVNDTGAHGQLSSTRKSLASTESTLASTNASLTSTQHQLTSTQHQLTSTKANLVNANSAKTQLHNQLVSTQQDLAGVRGNLSDTQNQLNLQAGQLEIVKTCLSGFATALNADLEGDYSSGLAALQSVESACQEASTLFD